MCTPSPPAFNSLTCFLSCKQKQCETVRAVHIWKWLLTVPHERGSSVWQSNRCEQRGKQAIGGEMERHPFVARLWSSVRRRWLALALRQLTSPQERLWPSPCTEDTHTKKKLLARQCRVLVFASTGTLICCKMCAGRPLVALSCWVISCQCHRGSLGWRFVMKRWGVQEPLPFRLHCCKGTYACF